VAWSVVDLRLTSGRRFTPANHTIYLVEAIETTSTVYFDGRKKGASQAVHNWVCVGVSCELLFICLSLSHVLVSFRFAHLQAVVFGPEIELFPWLVYIYADPGSNCTVIVNVPNKGSTSASQHVELSMKKSNGYIDGIFDIETIGTLTIGAVTYCILFFDYYLMMCFLFFEVLRAIISSRAGVDHVHMISSSNLNLTVTGSPSNADLYLQGGFGSEIHIRELYSHALVSNFARVTIDAHVLSRKAAVVVVGASEIFVDVYATSRYGNFYDGCLQLPEVIPNPYSHWMRYVVVFRSYFSSL
jgi:hypothetical protein